MSRFLVVALVLVGCNIDSKVAIVTVENTITNTITNTVTETVTVEVPVEDTGTMDAPCDPAALPRMAVTTGTSIENIGLVILTDGVCDSYELVETSLEWVRTDYYVFETTVYWGQTSAYGAANPQVIDDDINTLDGGPNIWELEEIDTAYPEITRFGYVGGNDAVAIDVVWSNFTPVLLDDQYELRLDAQSQELLLSMGEYSAHPRVLLTGPNGEVELIGDIDFQWPLNLP